VIVLVAFSGGTAQASFENIDVSPRVRAMGGAFVALADDESAVFYNPAGLSGVEGRRLYSSYTNIAGYDFNRLVPFIASISLGEYGTAAISYRDFETSWEDVELTSEKTVVISHGFTVMKDVHSSLSLGWAMNMYGLSFGTSYSGVDLGSEWTYGIDLGVQATLHNRARIGFMAKNLNAPSVGTDNPSELPRWIVAGFAYSPYTPVWTTLDLDREVGEEVRARFGAEVDVTEYLKLRTGVHNRPDSFSVGFGVAYSNVRVDYGYSSHATLPGTHQFGLGLVF
jgi:hypothetical protein